MLKEAKSIQITISFIFAGLLLIVFTVSIILPLQPGQTVSAMNLLQAEDTATPTATLEDTPTPTFTPTFTSTRTPTFITGVLTCNTVVAGVTCTNYGTYLDYNININVTGLTGGTTAYNITIGTYKRSTSGGNMGMMSNFVHSETSIYSQNKVFSMVRVQPFDAARVDYASFTSGAGTNVYVVNNTDSWRYIGGTRNYPNTLSVRGNVDWPITGYSIVGHIYLYSNQYFVTVTPTSTATATFTATLTPTSTSTSTPTVTPTPTNTPAPSWRLGNFQPDAYGVRANISAPIQAPYIQDGGESNWVSLPTPYWVQSGWRYYKGWIWAWSYVESFSPTTGYEINEYSIHNWGNIIEYKVEWTGGTTWC